MKASKSKKKGRTAKAKAPKKRTAKRPARRKTADDGGGMGPPG
jgi:hypothetical protein